MIDSKYLLNDEQMQKFIADGFVVLKSGLPESYHQSIKTKINEVFPTEGNPGNNVLPRIPEIQKFFDDPVVRGALTSVLGPNYKMHPHRHCHHNAKNPQSWHKDSYWGYAKIRNHHPWWAMIFYFPQDTTLDMGPSGIVPGSSYTHGLPTNTEERGIMVDGKAGTFALIQYDLWHRGSANLSGLDRAMLKFQFVRMEAPTAPSWNHGGGDWPGYEGQNPEERHDVIWRHMWNWLKGEQAAPVSASQETIDSLIAKLGEPESVSLNAAYELAAIGSPATDALAAQLANESDDIARNAAYALAAIGGAAAPAVVKQLAGDNAQAQMFAAFALGEIGAVADVRDSVQAMLPLLKHSSGRVRHHAVEALGLIKQPADLVTEALVSALGDENEQVRFNVCLSLLRIGSVAEKAVPALIEALEDSDRYVRAYAVDALHRIGTKEAHDALFKYLLVSRWCPTTTPASTF